VSFFIGVELPGVGGDRGRLLLRVVEQLPHGHDARSLTGHAHACPRASGANVFGPTLPGDSAESTTTIADELAVASRNAVAIPTDQGHDSRLYTSRGLIRGRKEILKIKTQPGEKRNGCSGEN
jgi:hypothetical protein